MKKILLLGGSAQQVVAIQTAKELGYTTVLCDFLPDNPGQFVADTFYLVSTTDKEAVLKVAQKEEVDGVLAYASDPAAPTAAYVAEQLGLAGNPYETVEILCNKDKFRAFLKEYGFPSPSAEGYSSVEEAMAGLPTFSFPVIVKPVDSSGSKGATVLRSSVGGREAIEFAFSFSRAHKIIIEQFIEKAHPYLIGGDIFVNQGKIILWGLMNCHRDARVNPLVPVGKSYPALLSEEQMKQVKAVLQRLVETLHIGFGAMNVELIIDEKGSVYLIDVGPRSGGNMIPDLLAQIFDVDVVEMVVQTAMGQALAMDEIIPKRLCATHNLHAVQNGTFLSVEYSEDVKPFLFRQCLYKKMGEQVEKFDNAAKVLGILFLQFPKREDMERILSRIDEHVIVRVK